MPPTLDYQPPPQRTKPSTFESIWLAFWLILSLSVVLGVCGVVAYGMLMDD